MTISETTRRRVLIGGLALSTAALVGCSNDPDEDRTSAPTPTGAPAAGPSTTRGSGAKVLLAYFSRPGENYYYGDRTHLDVGNTQVVAELIAGATTVDVHRIEAADPYPDSYDETVARNVREQDEDARPAIAGPLPSPTGYDTVLLGSPIWNVQPPMIMATFVEAVDLRDKVVLPFVTYAVSGLGDTIDFYSSLVPAATIGDGLAVRGEEASDAQPAVTDWLRRTGLLDG